MKVYQRIAQLISWNPVDVIWQDTKDEEIEDIEGLILPSGSGFDSGCHIDMESSRPDRIVISADYHHISEYGYYTGWTNHLVIVTPSLSQGFDLRVTGKNTKDDIKEYIAEVFSEVLSAHYPRDIAPDTEDRLHQLVNTVDMFLSRNAGFAELREARSHCSWL